MASQNICGRCATLGKTCCQETDIYLTRGDIRRIAGAITVIDFYEYRKPTDHLYLEQDDDPAWFVQTVRSDGTRRVLKHKNGTDCLFLGTTGCQLSKGVRPLVCRLHPYTYTMKGLAGIEDPRCRRAQAVANGELSSAMDMGSDQVQAWHLQLYSEIFIDDEGEGQDENRHHL